MKHLLFTGLLAMGVAGCSWLPSAEPMQSWTLEPAPAVAGQSVQVESLRVLRPQTPDLLNGRHMLVVPQGKPPSVYAGARWSSAIPELWRDQLISALQRDSRFSQISGDEVRLAADRVLVSRLDAFQTEYHQGVPTVVIRGHLQLVEANGRTILAETSLDLSRPADSSELVDVVDAFSSLSAEMADVIKQWLLKETAK
jgi:cholesterol transport system auxiliary component